MRGLLFVIVLTLMAGQVAAQPALTQPISDNVAVLGPFKLRLPAGSWREVKQIDLQQVKLDGGGVETTPTSRRVYVQEEGGRFAAMLIFEGSVIETEHGWRPPRLCFRNDTFWSDDRNGWTQNYDCALVNHVGTRETDKTSELMRAAYGAVRETGELPKQLIWASFADARLKHQLAVSVVFNPGVAGLVSSGANWKNSEWQAERADAAHKAYMEQVATWAASYREVVRAALP